MFEIQECVTISKTLEELEPGPELATALAAVDWVRLSRGDLITALRAQRRLVAHYQAGAVWTINEVAERYERDSTPAEVATGVAARGAETEVAAALRLTRRSAEYETSLAIELSRRLPKVWRELRKGRIDLRRAAVIVDGLMSLDTAAAQTAAEMILPDAAGLTTGQLAHRLRRLCADIDPDDTGRRYESSLDDRRLICDANPSGTANLMGLDLAPHLVESVRGRIQKEALRLRGNGDTRTMDQLRADLFLQLLRGQGFEAEPVPGGVHLTADLPTLAGLAETSGDLAGFGPVIADIARQVATQQNDAPWDWTITDPATRMPIATGTTRRRPDAGQRRRVKAVDPACVFPGCRMPAIDCDIDHTIPYADSRRTRTEHLAPLCRHHHVVRHRWGWSYRRTGNGDYVFTSPLGRCYTTSGRDP
jgi:hypothetical protein